MILNILALIVVILIAYIWMTRGFFSSFLHMICVIAAGAIAFGLWEPLGYMLLDKAGPRGVASAIGSAAWALALVIPFAVSLALLRAIMDSIVRANVLVGNTAEHVGGGLCGLVSGVISAGILVLAIGFLRLPTDFMKYQAVGYTNVPTSRGSLQRISKLILPVDKITAGFYEALSMTSLSTADPLAKWYPSFEDVSGPMRVSFGNGKARNTMNLRDFSVLGQFVIGDQDNGTGWGELLGPDIWFQTTQTPIDLQGKTISRGYVAGISILFKAGAKDERSAQVVMGNGQIRLLVQSQADGSTMSIHPVAIITLAEAAGTEYGRFRYDGNEVFIASVGGQSEARMAFEFGVPAGHKPIAVYVKNTRKEFNWNPTQFETSEERTAAIQDDSLLGGVSSGSLDWEGATEIGDSRNTSRAGGRSNTVSGRPVVSNNLPFRSIIQKGTERTLKVQKESRRGGGYRIVGGEAILSPEDMSRRSIQQILQIRGFVRGTDTTMVQLDVSIRRGQESPIGKSLQAADQTVPPSLVDSAGRRYDAVGYVYKDKEKVIIRYTPSSPLRGLSDAPSISQSRGDQEMVLLFRCSRGVEIVAFAIGEKVIADYSDNPIITK